MRVYRQASFLEPLEDRCKLVNLSLQLNVVHRCSSTFWVSSSRQRVSVDNMLTSHRACSFGFLQRPPRPSLYRFPVRPPNIRVCARSVGRPGGMVKHFTWTFSKIINTWWYKPCYIILSKEQRLLRYWASRRALTLY